MFPVSLLPMSPVHPPIDGPIDFTQNACADTARDLRSTNFCTQEEKMPSPARLFPPKIGFHP
jgi:hypothetical protein